ncbi:MAG: glutamine-hydrolyzing carbamoyl-phosphate synthase small subunit, partial [Candidatus Sericytochromatia bacterium]
MVTKKARLIFDDGTIFPGKVFALSGDRYAEVVFNTAMTGYQEILTDPSYSEQMVVMTYPIIGSYGINPEDIESRKIFLEALIVKEYMPFTSNWRSHKTLQRYLEENNILGVEGMDTRAITRYLRQFGAKKAVLTSSDAPIESLLVKLNTSHNIAGINISKFASCEKPFQWEKPDEVRFRVAVLDCGIKYNILRLLHSHGCECTIFPSNTHVEQILKGRFDGMFLSNGPGDPGPIVDVVDTISQVLGKLPFFGICLGHQLLGQALGIRTYKLRFGHHGANHPIKNLRTGRV